MRPARKTSRTLVAVGVLAALLICYLLSYGPYLYLALGGHLGSGARDTLRAGAYRPCLMLAERSQIYARYVEWWTIRGLKAGEHHALESHPSP